MEPTGRVDLQQQPKSHPQIAPSPSQPMRPRRWLKFFLAAAILILVGIAMLPQIVAWSPLRHDLPRSRLKGFEGGIRVGSASLSWWGPTVLNDLELDAPDGKPFCRVRQVTEDCTVWGSLFRRTEPLHVLIEDPQLTVVLRDDGSNVEDAFGPVLAHPGHVLRQRTSKVTGAIVRIVDPATGAETNYQNGSVDAVSDAEDGSANRISVRAESIDSQPAANVELAARWPSRNSNGAAASRELSLRAVDLPLAGTEPLIRRLGSDVSLSGTVSGHVDCNSTGPPDDSHSQAMTGVWELKCHNLRIRSPSRIGTETLSPGPTDFRGRVTRAGLNIRIEDLHIKTDFSQIDGGIAILLDDSPAMPDAGGSATASSPKDLDLLGELDLVALTRLLPQSLGLREGAELKEGRVRFEIASRTEQSAPRWNGRLETSRIAALFGGEEVAWDQPLDVSFAAHRNRGRLEIDSIESQSDVFTLRGQATDSGLHLEAGCDLAKLATRLGQFVKTDGVELQGTLAAAADFTRDPAGDLVIESRGTAENLILRRQITRMIERRAGDLQPAIESAPPDPRSGAPPTVAPRNRKEMNSQRKAERQARQEARRRERIAHRQANQIVEIPVQEWQTVWTEPRFELTCQTRVDFSRRRLDITRLNVTSDGFQLRGTGSIAEIPSRCMLDLGGEIECDAERLVERVREVVGPFVHIAGHDTRQFSITGPLRGGPS
ncbi:MAG: hypothetical protein HY290_11440, partial [Planctomycetia bacterium]|nr:hypothetical protein [Planctomycetia bacterium]